ncbi:unnamed protein product [Rotaria magnacalcarata]|uniref:Coiled-coil domain-containing protein 169 n=2 Tax=Rotaria magnacalcarata TaxID=392030 RepID=A0A814JR70_9BILA|nr:unnamed protein product [Rotaria magnacalcarata]CAF2052395.1 unnamed protein product [Rotaria magnacalcarata]CAF2055060.1 unnamed protein product [Rotaria magnacalcarata]CAF2146487.1 unnamed protein product [Rotaria magnacalcarata]CAF3787050.1 unnamed protein product [Rotaria magnacalcarata]
MTTTHNSSEIERLKAEIHQEEQIKSSLEQSCHELQNTAAELEKRLKMIDEESNEWKTRFENQEEINRHLARQILLLEKNIDQAKEEQKTAKTRAAKADPNEVSQEVLSVVENEKKNLLSQLRDYEWRLEQENKAYHKANEERKILTNEITDIRNAISVMKERTQPTEPNKTERNGLLSNREPNENIPMDKRVLDPRKGPITRNAATRSLPKLNKQQ